MTGYEHFEDFPIIVGVDGLEPMLATCWCGDDDSFTISLDDPPIIGIF